MTPFKQEFTNENSNLQDFSPTKAKRLTEELITTTNLKIQKYCKQPNANQKAIEGGQKTIHKLWEIYYCCIPLTYQDVWNVVNANIESLKVIDPEFNCIHIVIQLGQKKDKPAYFNFTI